MAPSSNVTFVRAADHGILLGGDMTQTHELVLALPKPPPDEIRSLATRYYDAHAASYDSFDREVGRRNVTHRFIDTLIAGELRDKAVGHLLSFSCGTGRREAGIRSESGLGFEVTGVDLSPGMCDIARRNGLGMICGASHLPLDLPPASFDATIYLDSFGAIPCSSERRDALRNIARLLRPGAPLYLDVSNLADRFEWGPTVARAYEVLGLSLHGYDRGDFFFRKEGIEVPCFWHYFTATEISRLLTDEGLVVEWIRYVGYAHRSGEYVARDEGMMFVKAVRLP